MSLASIGYAIGRTLGSIGAHAVEAVGQSVETAASAFLSGLADGALGEPDPMDGYLPIPEPGHFDHVQVAS